MFFKKEIQLIQPKAGYKLGVDSSTERWVVVKFQSTYLGATTGFGFYGFLETMKEYPVMGRYSITTNYTGVPNTSLVIGLHANAKYKIWRYNINTLTLTLGTMWTLTGTAETQNQNTYRIDDDLDLYNVVFTKEGFVPNAGGNGGNHDGFVNRDSGSGIPFRRGSLYWVSL